jgi:hypothetical protein
MQGRRKKRTIGKQLRRDNKELAKVALASTGYLKAAHSELDRQDRSRLRWKRLALVGWTGVLTEAALIALGWL